MSKSPPVLNPGAVGTGALPDIARPLTVTTREVSQKKLRGLSDIRRFFHRNSTPIYFISATPFNLLGLDEWCGNFAYINYIDCFDGEHSSVYVPRRIEHDAFESIEDINVYLLSHPDVQALIRSRAPKEGGPAGKAVFLMFDERCEALCEELGLEVCFPPSKLREYVDDKLNTTRIADKAGVASVPNTLAAVDGWESLREAADEAGLGDRLVVQTAFGDSGHTTFFIENEEEYAEYAEEIEAAPEVKIMKRIRCRGSALEACVTRHGTIVGPLMTELVGFGELTPYKGGWCGNEVFAEAFDRGVRQKARESAFKFGEALRDLGYNGYFEIDFLLDEDTGDVYLGEVNPRVTGASSMTNLAAFAHADAPLFLFHLLEWMDVEYELDVHEINERWADPDNIDSWSQLVIKHRADAVDVATAAPRSGIWEKQADGTLKFVRAQTHRRTVRFDERGFYLRITGVGDYLYEGADLGILVTRGRFMTDDFQLNDEAKAWINGLRALYGSQSLDTPVATPQFKLG